MNLYIVTVDYTAECEARQHRVKADSPMEAVLQAGAFAGRDADGGIETFRLVAVDEVVETTSRVWTT